MQIFSQADKTTNNGPHNPFPRHIRRPRIIAPVAPTLHVPIELYNNIIKTPQNKWNCEHTLVKFSYKSRRLSRWWFHVQSCVYFLQKKIFFFYFYKMLGVFSSAIVSPPDELVAAGSRTPSPKISADALVKRFVDTNSSAVSVRVGDDSQVAFTHHNESMLLPR